jgi:hypothetical protein
VFAYLLSCFLLFVAYSIGRADDLELKSPLKKLPIPPELLELLFLADDLAPNFIPDFLFEAEP